MAEADRAAKSRLCRLLFEHPGRLAAEQAPLFERLVADRAVGPDMVARAGWLMRAREREALGEPAPRPRRSPRGSNRTVSPSRCSPRRR